MTAWSLSLKQEFKGTKKGEKFGKRRLEKQSIAAFLCASSLFPLGVRSRVTRVNAWDFNSNKLLAWLWASVPPAPAPRPPGKSKAGVGAESTAQMHFLSSQLGSPFGLVYLSGISVSSYWSVLDTRHQCFHIQSWNRRQRGKRAEVKESADAEAGSICSVEQMCNKSEKRRVKTWSG